MASSQWMQDYRSTERLGQEIMELINERNSLQRTGSNTAKVQSMVRSKQQEYSRSIKQLKEQLMRESSRDQLTTQEAERRQNQLDSLISKEKQINQAFKPTTSGTSDFGRAGLFNEGFDRDRSDPWSNSRNENVDDMTPDSFRTRQDQMIAEQDKGLDVLSQVIQRQKMMGQTIGDEIDYQNDVIDDINDHVDATHDRLIRTEAKTTKVTKKASSCAMMVVIVLLLIAIVAAFAIPN